MTDVTVGIDIGTTSVKAVAADASGRILDRVRVPHPVIVPSPDRLEHDADRAWRRGPRRALARLLATGPRAVAVSTMVPSLTAVDPRGRPLTPGLLYGDGRGRHDPADGTDPTAGEVVGFLRWTVSQAPDAAGYWPAPAVANYALGRVAAVDFSTAFTSAPLFGSDGWDAKLCAQCGTTPAHLPDVQMMGSPLGRVTGTEIVLGAGGVDAMCEALVADADRPGDVLVNCGTTLIVWAKAGEERIAPGIYTTATMTPGVWSMGGPSNAGGLFLGWASELLGKVRPDDRVHPDDVPVWSPYIRGERSPFNDPNRRAVLHGLALTHGPAAVQRAAWEASGFVVRHLLDLAGVPVHRIVATGGGTRVPGWMQAMADCTGLPVHVAAVPEGAALGAAWLARMAAGLESGFDGASRWATTDRVVDPDPAWREGIERRYLVFRALAGAEGAGSYPDIGVT